MSAPNPSMWFFPKRQIAGGYAQDRIMRAINFSGLTNYYTWDTTHPTDTIKLDLQNNSDLLGTFHPIQKKSRDYLGRGRVDSRSFEFCDKLRFSGTINGVAIGIQDLAPEGKTVFEQIFNNFDESTVYIMWRTIYDSDGNFIKISFIGDIDKNNMPDQPQIIRNTENPSNLLRIPIITLNTAPVIDRLSKYSARDIGIWNHWQDGNVALAKADMSATAANQCAPFWGGMKGYASLQDLHGSGAPPVPIASFFGGNITAETNFGTGLSNAAIASQFFETYNLTTQSVFKNDGSGLNQYGIAVGSHRNGFYGVRLQAIVDKIALFAGCDPGPPGVIADTTFIGLAANWNNTTKGYDFEFGDSQLGFVAVYNILFGIDPRGHLLAGTTSTGIGNVIRASVAHGNTSDAAKFPTPQEGQEIFIEGATDPNANGIWAIQNIVLDHPVSYSDRYTFDLVTSVSTLTSAGAAGTVNDLFSSAVTYPSDFTSQTILREICDQFFYKIKFHITQTGANKGMPYFQFVNRRKAGNALPAGWIAGTKFHRQPRKVISDSVKVSQMGSDAYVICPANHKLPPLDIPPLRWRSHQWGLPNGVFPANFTFNGDRAAFGNLSDGQESTSYTGNSVEFPLDDDGWLAGSVLYCRRPDSHFSYPPSWNPSFEGNHLPPPGLSASDWDGFPALQALIFAPGGVPTTMPVSRWNACFDVARLAYLEQCKNREVYARDFTNVSFNDDLDQEIETSWQVRGALKTFRWLELEYDDENGCIPDTLFEESPSDYNDLDSAPACAFFGGKNNSSTSVSAAGGTNSGNGNPVGGTPTEDRIDTLTVDNTTGSADVSILTTFSTLTDYTIKIKSVLLGKRLGGSAGGAVGDSLIFELIGDFKNVAGVLTQVGSDGAETPVPNEDDTAADGYYDIVGTDILAKVQTPTHEKILWKLYSRQYFV